MSAIQPKSLNPPKGIRINRTGVKCQMEKNRIRPVKNGKSLRMSFSRQKEVLEMPNLIEIQKNSYNWFLTEGLKEVFDDISPIEDYSNHLSLNLLTSSSAEMM